MGVQVILPLPCQHWGLVSYHVITQTLVLHNSCEFCGKVVSGKNFDFDAIYSLGSRCPKLQHEHVLQ